jgi:hypothetical protein
MWLEISLPDLSAYTPVPNTATNIRWANSVGHVLLSSVEPVR